MLRFTIRDVLLITAIAALALGWTIDRSRLAQSNQELTRMANRLADTRAQWVVQRERLQRRVEQLPAAPNATP